MSEIQDNIDYSEETMEKHSRGCPMCKTGKYASPPNPNHGGHAWMMGVPLGDHYAVYDSGTWAWPANRIGFADAIAFAVENGQDVYLNRDTCGKQSEGVMWSFLEYFPEGTEGHCHPNSENHQAKVTLGEVLANECYDIDEIVVHWVKRPTPPPPPPYDGPRGPRKRSRK